MTTREKELEAALALLLFHVLQLEGLFPQDAALQDAIKDAQDALE
jgi:hypothetical protein